ncbi:hypothetical protein TTHERM_00013590 (macronuclear) [Tetrahymena thermophila SB210]|uniref:Importin subunit alpha n=1 Tax=Tetrahymena thermophila (strain SB210) TaxID=312017 RepID=Q22RM9_TETTS|nr:hypothetical protein TTHERM_00013590 [Tetrahymena thermophila SB210]EAR88093.2 hypothetical protein TTHERM_00013590 [Tetrahymena thermophila SB210]|eukprot:XP_001008338.2 hypothetical protein TTHERM_00013590 [Tetrahymena thermophila SB210]
MDTQANESEDIHRLIYFKKEQFQNQARKQYRDQIFQKKRVKMMAQELFTKQEHFMNFQEEKKIQYENIQEDQIICNNIKKLKSQDLDQIRQALQYFKSQALKAAKQDVELNTIRLMVDSNIIYELIDLFNTTKDLQGKYLLPNDIAADGLYVLAIIASGDDQFTNSIINKNGLTIFKDYTFQIDNDPLLQSSAYLGLVNLCSLDRKEVRKHLKSIGVIEHLQTIVANNINRLGQEDYRQMIENGVWLVSVLCFDPPETEAEFNQLFNTLPLLISCLNTGNIKIIKDVIWIIDICLTQIPQKKSTTIQADPQFSQKLISLGLSEAFQKTVKIENKKIAAQTFRGLNKLMKLSTPNQIEQIYSPEQIKYILPVLKSKLIHNQYYAINYLNEVCYQSKFKDFLQYDDILKQLMLIIEQKQSDKFTQLILQSILKILEQGDEFDIKRVFDTGLLSVLETTLVYSEDGEKSAPQNIILSLQILLIAYQIAISNQQYLIKLQRMSLERLLNSLQTHPLDNIYQLNLQILEKYYEEA